MCPKICIFSSVCAQIDSLCTIWEWSDIKNGIAKYGSIKSENLEQQSLMNTYFERLSGLKKTSFQGTVDERHATLSPHTNGNLKAPGTKDRYFSIIKDRDVPVWEITIDTQRHTNKSQGSTVRSIILKVSEHTHSATNLEMPSVRAWKCTLSFKVL